MISGSVSAICGRGQWAALSGYFNDALGELRAICGVHIGQLSTKFGIDLEDDLATILPALVDDDDMAEDEAEHRPRD
jgi:hypothetical protein